MQGVRTFSIFAGSAAFQIFLVVAIADLPEPAGPLCSATPRPTLAERMGLRDVPEVYEVFGLADPPALAASARTGPAEFGCLQY
jgi:hypothetical protein